MFVLRYLLEEADSEAVRIVAAAMAAVVMTVAVSGCVIQVVLHAYLAVTVMVMGDDRNHHHQQADDYQDVCCLFPPSHGDMYI